MQEADYTGGTSTITLPAGTYEYTLPDTTSSTDNPAVGDLDVNSGVTLTITGAGASTTIIDPNFIDRAFAVQSGGSLSLSGVTIEHGSQSYTLPSDDSLEPGYGGGIYNDGSLTVTSSVLTDNSSDEEGGAVYTDSSGSATSITNSTLTGNTSDGPGGGLAVTSGTITLSGDTITNNTADSEGGAVYDDEGGNTVGALTVSSSTLSDNTADSDGGAVYLDQAGALNITGSTLDNNASDDDDGGAIYDYASGNISIGTSSISGNASGDDYGGGLYAYLVPSTTITGSTFADDAAGSDDGGGAYVGDGTVTLSGSTFQNDSGGEGGALYVDGPSATAASSITTTSFIGNLATDDSGGAVYDDYGALSVSRSTFAGNDSSYYGGAFYYDSDDGLTLTNDTFDGNEAVEGGAVYLDGTASTGTVTLLNNTIARNTAYEGGGLYNPQNANSIKDTIVAENHGGYFSYGGGDCYGTALTANAASADLGGNIDSDGTCFSNSVTGDQTSVNPLLGALASNGGPTQTDALLAGSPAIGSAVAGCPSTDERGVTRSGACDIGAFQTGSAVLGIGVSGPGTGTVGAPLTYTVTVTNNGPAAATGVSVTDAVPTGTTYYASTSSQGSCTGTTTVVCSLGTLDSSLTGTTTTATVTITVLPTTPGSVSDAATVSAAAPASSHTASASTTVASNTTTTTTTTTTTKTVTNTVNHTTTVYLKPLAGTSAATTMTQHKVLLKARVNPGGQATAYTFQIVRAGHKAWKTIASQHLGAGTGTDAVTFTVKGLKANRHYACRVKATNASGTSYGQVVHFRTK